MPERIGRLLTLVQFLIGYGKECAATLRQHAMTPQFRLTMQARFGTSDMARILIRIGRALKLAAALDSPAAAGGCHRPGHTDPYGTGAGSAALVRLPVHHNR